MVLSLLGRKLKVRPKTPMFRSFIQRINVLDPFGELSHFE
jgi:hypothetical protein